MSNVNNKQSPPPSPTGSSETGVSSSSCTSISRTDDEDAGSQAPIVQDNQIFKTYKRRWLILIALTVFGITNSAVDNQSVILDTMLKLLDISLEKYVNIGIAFSYLSIVITVPSAFLIDRFGIRKGLYVCTLLFILKNLFKALMFNEHLPKWHHFRRIYWILSGILGNLVIAFFWCLPLKISETWFPVNERSFSWATMNAATNVGFILSSITYPRLVHDASDLMSIYYIIIGATIVTTLTVATFVTKSKPKYPPSERTLASMRRRKVSHFQTIKRICTHKDMMLHLLHSAAYDGVSFAVLAIKQDILLTSGHSKIFIGNLMAVDSFVLIVTLMLLSTLIHRVENVMSMCKISSISKSILFAINCATLVYPVDDWLVVLTSVSYSILRSWASPNYTNMTAQLASGNVSEATAASFSITLLIIFLTASQFGFIQLVRYTPDGSRDYTNSMIFACATIFLISTLYLIFFKAKPSSYVSDIQEQNENDSENQQATEVPVCGSQKRLATVGQGKPPGRDLTE